MSFFRSSLVQAAAAGGASYLIVRHAPKYAVLGSGLLTFFTGITILLSISFIYSVWIYPFYVSPLADIPTAPVSSPDRQPHS